MKAAVLSRCVKLGNAQGDPALMSGYYDQVVLDLAQLPILVQATLLAVGPGLPTTPEESYGLPLTCVVPLQFFYEDMVLPELSAEELFAHDRDWRAMVGRPIGVYREGIGLRRFRLYPQPDVPPAAYIFAFGAPLGADYPAAHALVIHTANPQDVPLWLEPAMTWFILAREFTRDSDHVNPIFAQRCALLAQAELEAVR
jgi:hypothetical protein